MCIRDSSGPLPARTRCSKAWTPLQPNLNLKRPGAGARESLWSRALAGRRGSQRRRRRGRRRGGWCGRGEV
eukprot:2597161-Rhodomonas_salina.1